MQDAGDSGAIDSLNKGVEAGDGSDGDVVRVMWWRISIHLEQMETDEDGSGFEKSPTYRYALESEVR
jgi:hypothetical protein